MYFDVYVLPSIADVCSNGNNLATCIQTFYNSYGSNVANIYYHDSSLVNGAGDNSYRYAGASDIVNNYVCFGSNEEVCPSDNLYRIIGVFDNQVKLIKNASYGSYNWSGSSTNSSNVWGNSTLNMDILNNVYYNSLGSVWNSKIVDTSWNVGGHSTSDVTVGAFYINEVTNNSTTYSSPIGLMYVSDYGFATIPENWTTVLFNYNIAEVLENNWLYYTNEWTITRSLNNAFSAFVISDSGLVNSYFVDTVFSNVRPTFYLVSSVTYKGGTGTSSNPILIN